MAPRVLWAFQNCFCVASFLAPTLGIVVVTCLTSHSLALFGTASYSLHFVANSLQHKSVANSLQSAAIRYRFVGKFNANSPQIRCKFNGIRCKFVEIQWNSMEFVAIRCNSLQIRWQIRCKFIPIRCKFATISMELVANSLKFVVIRNNSS